jgi:hypothetical protein
VSHSKGSFSVEYLILLFLVESALIDEVDVLFVRELCHEAKDEQQEHAPKSADNLSFYLIPNVPFYRLCHLYLYSYVGEAVMWRKSKV